jgi:hypothetical protein
MRRRLILGAMVWGLLGGLAPAPAPAGGVGEVDGAREAPWRGHLRAMDRALDRRDAGAAEQAWHEAYLTALGSWPWDGMVDVADAYVRLIQASTSGGAAIAKARHLYVAAFFRARQQRSVDGVLRAAEGFARVGDRAAARQALRLAERLAAELGDPRAPDRIRALGATLADGPATR